MSTSPTEQQSTGDSAQSFRPTVLIGAGIAAGVTIWSVAVLSAVFLWKWISG